MSEVKYYDLYTTDRILETCNLDICYGHSLRETAGWYIEAGRLRFIIFFLS